VVAPDGVAAAPDAAADPAAVVDAADAGTTDPATVGAASDAVTDPVAAVAAPDAVATDPAAVDAGASDIVAAAPTAVAASDDVVALVAAPDADAAPAPDEIDAAAPQAVAPAASLPWPRLAVFELALRAFKCGDQEGHFRRPVLTIIDYSLPATERRLWVIDLPVGRVLHHELVAHGEHSGENLAVAFSNRIDSHQSSLGLFRTDDIYTGQYGYALRLSGLEPGINDNARARAIVFHGSSDVSPEFAAQWGTIGRSWGCPALPPESSVQVIDGIAGGSAVFAYYPDAEWLRDSRYLHCDEALADGMASAEH
jgi:hypothetical protein